MPRTILHMLTPHRHVSPFDVNMAVDAGYDVVVPYEGVTLADVPGLVQDAIFSRPPAHGSATGLFFGGDDAGLALDMVEAAKSALVPPFGAQILADPRGGFTTAAALLASVERVLAAKTSRRLAGVRIAVFGATGVVGTSAAVIAALEGAEVTLVGHDGAARVAARAAEMTARFGVALAAVEGSGDADKAAILQRSDVVLAAAKAGIEVVGGALLAGAPHLLLAADVNAVPPAGIAGLQPFDDGAAIAGTTILGIGALAVGNLKYRTQAGLLRRMISSPERLALDVRDAFALARALAAEP